jgi:dolichol-phosphate mannosyltransferase
MTRPHLTIVIPSYKEAANIPTLLERIHISLADYPYDVLVIDDNSPDGTADVIRSLANKYPASVVVRTDKRGLASAVVDGFRLAKGELVAVMDADLQHPPSVLPRLVEAIAAGADLSIGSRYVPGGSVGNWSATRRLISKGAVFLSHLLLPSTRGIKDPMSGLFMLRREVLTGIDLSPVGYKILLEVICLGRSKKTVEVPFVFENRRAGTTKLSMLTQTDYLRHLLSLMKRTGELTRMIKFIAVGASGTVVNLSILALATTNDAPLLGKLIAGAIAFEASVIWNFILNDRFTFGDRRQAAGSFIGRLLRFNTTSLGGFVIYLGILALLTEVFGLHYILSAAIGIVAAFGWNFLVNSAWTWR